MSAVAISDPDQLAIATIRTLCIDAVQQANSGHPGTPMAMAPVAYTLWQRFLRFDPDDPIWPNRDRFVLSMGHASTLLYSLLHLTKVKAVNPAYESLGELSVKLEDLRNFRQLDSRCPGHPEYRWTSGIETTTGPLGQGVATSVGMAIASRWLAARYNRPGFELFDFDTYAIAGDGCLMEGVSGEAASLAGHLKLSNLCWIYDNNHITIEGNTSLAFSEDVATRFVGYGWNVVRVADANDLEMLSRAFETFRREVERPTLVIVDSHIAYGAPTKQDTSGAHGEPLGEEEVRATKRNYAWPEDASFLIPEGVDETFEVGIRARGKELRDAWLELFARYEQETPDLADELRRMQKRQLPEGWDAQIPEFPPDDKGLAGRDASSTVLNAIAERVPWLVGGSAGQPMPTLDRTRFGPASGLRRGGYVLADPNDGSAAEVILIATGSEVGLAVQAFEQLSAEGVGVRVVSMPSWELFDAQPSDYRDEVLPPSVTARVAIEQASTFGWERYVGAGGAVIGMDTFGASAPLKHLQTKFGFTPEAVVGAAKARRAAASG